MKGCIHIELHVHSSIQAYNLDLSEGALDASGIASGYFSASLESSPPSGHGIHASHLLFDHQKHSLHPTTITVLHLQIGFFICKFRTVIVVGSYQTSL